MPPKKGKGKDAGDDDGKKKSVAPTEVEREELRVRILALEDRLWNTQRDLEHGMADFAASRAEQQQQLRDQKDVVAYLNKEIEKKDTENASLMQKYVLLREEKEAEETRLTSEMDTALQGKKAMTELQATLRLEPCAAWGRMPRSPAPPLPTIAAA